MKRNRTQISTRFHDLRTFVIIQLCNAFNMAKYESLSKCNSKAAHMQRRYQQLLAQQLQQQQLALHRDTQSVADVIEEHRLTLFEASGIENRDEMPTTEWNNTKQNTQPATLEKLEIFQEPRYRRLLGLEKFTGLKTLEVMQQSLAKIEGLQHCTQLRTLRLTGNCIENITGLEQCTKLRTLCLAGNRLKRIENISHLKLLQSLYVYDNAIESLDGIAQLTDLVTLNAANNCINRIDDCDFTSLTKLSTLNISGNKIYRWECVHHLSRIKQLAALSLQDVHFGSNPLCIMLNYRVIMILYFKQLEMLDGCMISEMDRANANELFSMKQIFYDSQIRVLRRDAKHLKRSFLREVRNNVNRLFLMRRSACISMKQLLSHAALSCDCAVLLDKQKKRFNNFLEHLNSIASTMQAIATDVIEITEKTDSKLQCQFRTEHSTCGNIRYSVASASCAWFIELENFFHSRYRSPVLENCKSKLKLFIVDICKVYSHIQNTNFEYALQSKATDSFDLESDNKNRTPITLRLLYKPHNVSCSSVEQMVQDLEDLFLDINEPVYMFSHFNENTNYYNTFNATALTGRVVVVASVNTSNFALVSAKDLHSARKADYDGYDGVICEEILSCSNELLDCSCIVFNQACILPEFLVVYDFIRIENSASTTVDAYSFLHNFSSEFLVLRRLSNLFYYLVDTCTIEPFSISDEKECFMNGEILDLSGRNEKLAAISNTFSGICVLNVSFASLDSLAALQSLKALTYLDVSNNSLSTLGELKMFTELRYLDLSYNHVVDQHELLVLHSLHDMQFLDVRQNPCSVFPNLYQYVDNCIRLELFNGQLVHGSTSCAWPFIDIIALSPSFYMHLVSAIPDQHDLNLATSEQFLKSRSFPQPLNETTVHVEQPEDSDQKLSNWCDQVNELLLDDFRFANEITFSNFQQLNTLSLCGCALSTVTPLLSLVALESLDLEDNSISDAAPLVTLTRLSYLNINYNQVSSLVFISELTRLCELFADGNCVRELPILIKSHDSLIELHLRRNQISDVRQIARLRQFTVLSVLSLDSNPICTESSCRHLILFHMPTLHVLNGCSVSFAEVDEAVFMYEGKLTVDDLEQIVGHQQFDFVDVLSLQSKQLRMVGSALQSAGFVNLRQLILDDNRIASVEDFPPLPLLLLLRLNGNMIENIPLDDNSGLVNRLAHCYPVLEVLELGYNGIRDLQKLHLRGFKHLRVLNLEGNALTSLAGLDMLHSLEQLLVANNKLRLLDLSELSNVFNIRGINAEQNNIRSIAGIIAAPNISSLLLAHNRLSDLSELDWLSPARGFVALRIISFEGNPLARKLTYRSHVIRTCSLCDVLDGQPVTLPEREMATQIFAPLSKLTDGTYDNCANEDQSMQQTACSPSASIARLSDERIIQLELNGIARRGIAYIDDHVIQQTRVKHSQFSMRIEGIKPRILPSWQNHRLSIAMRDMTMANK